MLTHRSRTYCIFLVFSAQSRRCRVVLPDFNGRGLRPRNCKYINNLSRWRYTRRVHLNVNPILVCQLVVMLDLAGHGHVTVQRGKLHVGCIALRNKA